MTPSPCISQCSSLNTCEQTRYTLSVLPAALRQSLDDFSLAVREAALAEIHGMLGSGELTAPSDAAASRWHNLHCHSFFSYNGYGFSPITLAVLAKLAGWRAVGMVDFDVLDGADEFYTATQRLGVPSVVGMETRVFIPELANIEVNSPGEPGIAYHLGMRFSPEKKWSPFTHADPAVVQFSAMLRENAAGRIKRQITAVNNFLQEVNVDLDEIAAMQTPRGNVTERHLCRGYRLAAAAHFTDRDMLANFWMAKLKLASRDDAAKLIADDVVLEGAIRAALMKSGGVAYLPPTPESFPTLAEMNAFTTACGAVPAMAWLNGFSAGEADPERLLDLHLRAGAQMLIIIPDRNHNIGDSAKRAKQIHELERVVVAARERELPIVIGTEMNAHGQRWVDDFDAELLQPFIDDFIAGADVAAF